jgi:hypothetical protein
MEENIPPELVTPLQRCLLLIKSVRVVEFHRQMKPAIRIESFNGIEALRYLRVSLTEFRSGCATANRSISPDKRRRPGAAPTPRRFRLEAEEGGWRMVRRRVK